MRAVTHSFPVFTLGFRLGENRKPVGYMGTYTTLFHEVTDTYIIASYIATVTTKTLNSLPSIDFTVHL